MMFCGIDVAKNRHELCMTDESGSIIQQTFIGNSQKGFQKLLQNLDRLKLKPSGIEFCMEATGHYWLLFTATWSNWNMVFTSSIQSSLSLA